MAQTNQIRKLQHFGNACGFMLNGAYRLGPNYPGAGYSVPCCYVRNINNNEYIGFIEKPSGNFPDYTLFRVIVADITGGTGYFTAEIQGNPIFTKDDIRTDLVNEPLNKREAKVIYGNVYIAVVVQTKEVPAGEGLQSSVSVSEVLYQTDAFIAADDTAARATALAEAAEKHDIDINDRVKPVEVKLIKGV